MRYTVVLEQEEDRGHVASVPALPDASVKAMIARKC
jgi:predicted RNase H-like HicB family nuclease